MTVHTGCTLGGRPLAIPPIPLPYRSATATLPSTYRATLGEHAAGRAPCVTRDGVMGDGDASVTRDANGALSLKVFKAGSSLWRWRALAAPQPLIRRRVRHLCFRGTAQDIDSSTSGGIWSRYHRRHLVFGAFPRNMRAP